MNLISKIKSYFVRHSLHAWKDFSPGDYEVTFHTPGDDALVDVAGFIVRHLRETGQIGNKRHRLREEVAVPCASLDELMLLVQQILERDFHQTTAESLLYDWEFRYFLAEHTQCADTICLSNALVSRKNPAGHCIYPLATIQKSAGVYYCWNHLT